MRVHPEFADELKKLGATKVTECFNCGNCTAICPLSTNEHMFPRRIIRYIQLGLADKAKSAPEPWLCHACGECSVTCPRQAFPSEIMNGVRNYAMQKFAVPGFMAKLFTSPAYLPIVFLIPLILLYGFLAALGFPPYPEGEIIFSKYIEPTYLEIAGLSAGAYVIIVALASLWRFNNALGLKTGFFSNLIRGIILILKHSRFAQCETNRFRYFAHIGVFYGFILLGISTLGAVVYLDFLGIELSLPLTDPVKIIGNVGAILLMVGALWIIYARLSNRERIGSPSYNDWFFISMLFLVGLTGLILEALRFAQSVAAYPTYLVHLIFVFCLLIYAPYSKFAHLLYRGLVYVYIEAEQAKQEEQVELVQTVT